MLHKTRSVLTEIDETMPEIRDTWTAARETVWAYVRFTAIGAVLIVGAGAWLGVGALLSNAHAATYDYIADVPAGSARMCGRADPVLDLKVPAPVDGSSLYDWRERWRVATCSGHNPAVSCPAGLVQWHHMRGGTAGSAYGATYRDYICYDIAAPPAPWPAAVTVTPPDNCDLYVRGCGSVELWPLHNGEYWGHWPGGWDPKYGCPPGYGKKVQDFTYANLGVYRFTCKI